MSHSILWVLLYFISINSLWLFDRTISYTMYCNAIVIRQEYLSIDIIPSPMESGAHFTISHPQLKFNGNSISLSFISWSSASLPCHVQNDVEIMSLAFAWEETAISNTLNCDKNIISDRDPSIFFSYQNCTKVYPMNEDLTYVPSFYWLRPCWKWSNLMLHNFRLILGGMSSPAKI